MKHTYAFIIGMVFLITHSAANAQQSAPPGKFDYYVLSLSWSPQFCQKFGPSNQNNIEQCARPYSFVLHGLWPQNNKGYPQYCTASTPVPSSLSDSLPQILPEMRSDGKTMAQYEWDKHGTCDGTDQATYFAKAVKAFNAVKVPEAYRSSTTYLSPGIGGLKKAFVEANVGLTEESIAPVCSGRYLSELRLCLNKETLAPQACGPKVSQGCSGDTLTLRPVRASKN